MWEDSDNKKEYNFHLTTAAERNQNALQRDRL